MKKSITIITLTICFILTGVLSSCQNSPIEPTPTITLSNIPAPTPTLVPDRMGAYLDNIYMFEAVSSQAANLVLDGGLDIYSSGLKVNQLDLLMGSNVPYKESVNRQYELLLNPSNTTIKTGVLNPLSFAEIRSAINLVLDRQYIAQEIFSNGAVKKYQPLIYKSSDYNKNEATINALAIEYAYDFDTASEIISQALKDNGCKLNEDGKWTYKRKLLNLTILIRNDDEQRIQIGEYTANQLENLGFTITRQYLSLSESTSLWAASDPKEGLWHIYTGRRTFDNVNINQQNVFADYYSDLGAYKDIELYKSFITDDKFSQDALTLLNNEYSSISQRDEMMTRLISTCNDYSFRIWLVDELSYSPHSEKVDFINTMTTQTNVDYATVFSLQKPGVWGGGLNWGSSSLLHEPVNPVNGSTSPSETQYLNFINLPLIYEDSDTGEISSLFIDNIKMTYLNSLEYINDLDWVEVDTTDEIIVPTDAIISWSEVRDAPVYADAQYMNNVTGLATAWLATYEREKPKDRDKIKAQETVVASLLAIENRGYLTSNIKYVVEYDESIFDLTWHDGSKFSIADIIIAFITKTQLMNEESTLYDEYYAQQHEGELDNFKGFKIVSEYPLIIEYYTDDYALYTSQTINPLWIDYGTGQQSWAMALAANESIKDKVATYSEGISTSYGYDFLNYTDKNSISSIIDKLLVLETTGDINYEELISPYIDQYSAIAQYKSILDFYKNYKHTLIGIGPYMITNIDLLSPSLTLSSAESFPIKADDLFEFIK